MLKNKYSELRDIDTLKFILILLILLAIKI